MADYKTHLYKDLGCAAVEILQRHSRIYVPHILIHAPYLHNRND
jgi:hypothetical protein